jgi:hypothetical protein
MVHLSLQPVKLEPSAMAVTAVLGVGQRAQERLPDADAPLVERLFALECAAGAGAAGAPTAERYRSSLRDVDWGLADDWEPDVPHTVILAQALSASAALDLSTPTEWQQKLSEALEVLQKRSTKLSLRHDPALLATVLRGVAATELAVPTWLLDASESCLDEYSPVGAIVQLADALYRNKTTTALTTKAVTAAFAGADASDHDAAYARWWLSRRQPGISGHLGPSAVADARLQALAAAEPFDGEVAAMLMEVAFGEASQLIIGSETEIAGKRSKADAYTHITRALYRGSFFAALVVLGVLTNLHDIAVAIAPRNKTDLFEHLIVAVCFALLSFCITTTAEAVYKALDKEAPSWTTRFDNLIGLIAALIGAWVG